MLALPSQTPGLRERYGLSKAELDRELIAVGAGGRRYRGAGAFAAIGLVLGGPWAALAHAYSLPGVGFSADRMYAWFARHRGHFARWGVTPACERPGVPCRPADG